MNDQRLRIWNLLHDGEITAVSDEPSTTVKFFVCIPYLRRKFAPLGDSFVVAVSGVSLFEFHHFDGQVTTLRDALEIGSPEILSTESEAMPLAIETTLGQLLVAFESFELALDTGQPLEFSELDEACKAYWANWHARAEKAKLGAKTGGSG